MKYDAVKLELYKNLYASVAEEMGVVLCRTAFSPNIKERWDFSCTVFDSPGNMIAQAAHIPVHPGSMPLSVLSAIQSPRTRGSDIEVGGAVAFSGIFC
jgi:N-methylhydantoinase B